MSFPRRVIRWVLCIVVVVGLLLLADAGLAMRTERRTAQAVQDIAGLDVEPKVSIGGFPYTLSALTGEFSGVSATALDVDVPEFGMLNASSGYSAVEVTPAQVLSGDFSGALAELYTRTLSLDGVALGNQLGITDLEIANPYDISPSGGVASEAQLTGTPPGFDQPVTITAALRLDGPWFHLVPREVIDAPESHEQDALNAFRWDLDTRRLPLAQQAQAVYLRGGSIYFEAQRRNTTVDIRNLSPIESSADDN
ncbi:DUF2993 domain-containing protein [Corynebacterium uropygiale]|uniref:LmeA family phospholipid-binding protein n=1 Tax=Corynebacterium uropygiale TaxID=1775911 RepID=UPI001F1D3540